MKFSLMFFGVTAPQRSNIGYRDVLEAAKLADGLGLEAVWTPERHFDPFGGRFASPSVMSAAIASTTERIDVRAGSLISPLHDSISIAEEWSMVDNLSNGRAGISFGTGWNTNDFVFRPDRYIT